MSLDFRKQMGVQANGIVIFSRPVCGADTAASSGSPSSPFTAAPLSLGRLAQLVRRCGGTSAEGRGAVRTPRPTTGLFGQHALRARSRNLARNAHGGMQKNAEGRADEGWSKATCKPGECALQACWQRVVSVLVRCTYDIPAIYLRCTCDISPLFFPCALVVTSAALRRRH